MRKWIADAVPEAREWKRIICRVKGHVYKELWPSDAKKMIDAGYACERCGHYTDFME